MQWTMEGWDEQKTQMFQINDTSHKQLEWLSPLKQPPILAQSVPGRAPRVQEETTTDQAPG